MISIFSVHVTLGLVDPQFTSEEMADIVDIYSKEYGVPIGPGVAVVVPRPIPEDEEQEVMQAISPGTHEVNLVFDFDPNDDMFLNILAEDTMWNRYNVANQLCTTITFASLKTLDATPTYFSIKLSGDYIENELYEKMKKHRFNL
jgi:hypothetical protein